MKKKTRMLLLTLAALLFVGSVAVLLYRTTQYRQAAETYHEAEQLVDLPDFSTIVPPTPDTAENGDTDAKTPAGTPKPVYVDPYAKALRNMDFTALREVNPDVVGWILIPNTPISYPVVQGENNQYYLKRTWKKWNSVVGSIFLECENNRDLSDFNTIIYGHRMNNGSMFASLKHYKQQSYYAAHPSVYITDDSGTRQYEVFAAYEVSTKSSTYRLGFADVNAKQSFLDDCVGRSVIESKVIPTVYDQILTLSTCTGNGHANRWVVQARLAGAAPLADATPPADIVSQEHEESPNDVPASSAAPELSAESPINPPPPAA